MVTPSKLISILRARWSLVVLVVVLTTLTALGVSLMLPKKYVATASVVIDAKPDPISALIYPGLSSPAFMNTQVDVIASDRVALRVVRDLRLTEVPEFREQWQKQTGGEGTIEQWLVDFLQGSMDVKPSKESNVLTVAYRSQSPQFAASMANAFVRAYVATTLDLRVEPARQYAGYFDQQAKAALEKLEAAKGKLSAFERVHGIVASDERLDVENNRLVELSSQLVALQGLSSESTSRQGQAARGADQLPDVLANPVVMQIKADLSRAESKLQELSTRYGDNHPQVIEAKASVADQRTKLATEMRRVTGSVTVTNNINRQRESDVRAQLEIQREKVAKLKAARDDASSLMREAESAQRAYESITARLTQTNLESQSTQSNVNVLTEATAPLRPASPKIALNTALAFVVGLILAVGIALLLEMRDRKIRDADDVMAVVQLPMLGVLPAPNQRHSKTLPSAERRLLGRSATKGVA
ncbi:chain length determinant protein EpsF [Roseateles amylovorans]|uniref:Chain length determinant protein EpsF n=1 Tax=Roseateles amylovorans TaxID=2978473 RepID=A0ABY6B3R0_9BURK|nr:chain length determinant protein EpsF [Roseateles amylovorans]UXH79487.1 chain length determinant protein EpsF [Roseateles amylovorans]